MRVDPSTLAALQTRLLGLMRNTGEAARAGSFRLEGPPSQPAAAPPTPPAGQGVPAASLAMLVAAAQAPASRAATLRRAERGLAALERLHRLVRGGGDPAPALDDLAGWQPEERAGDGPEAALLDEVELRILVELAKGGR